MCEYLTNVTQIIGGNMDNFVNLNNLKNRHMTASEFILLLHSGRC